MTTYNTGNPIGSTDARDLYDNAENLDHAVNSELPEFVDRLGVTRKSLAGIQSEADAVVSGIQSDGSAVVAGIEADGVQAVADAEQAILDTLATIGSGGLPGAKFVQRIEADGVSTVYSLTATPLSTLQTDVYINGVYQQKNSYALDGTLPVTLVFSEAPPAPLVSGERNIEVIVSEAVMIGEDGLRTDLASAIGASMVGYTTAGSGAVVTDVQSKLHESVSVKDFGAVGDGVQNDLARQIAAHAAADGRAVTYPFQSGENYLGLPTVNSVYGAYQGAIKALDLAGTRANPTSRAEPIYFANKYSVADRGVNPSEWDAGGLYGQVVKVGGSAYSAAVTGHSRHEAGTGQMIGVHGRGGGYHSNAQVWGGWFYANVSPQATSGVWSAIGVEINMNNDGGFDPGWQVDAVVGTTRGLLVTTADNSLQPCTIGVSIQAGNRNASNTNVDRFYTGLLFPKNSIAPCSDITGATLPNNEHIRLEGSPSFSYASGGIRFRGDEGQGRFVYGISFAESSFVANCAVLIGTGQRFVLGDAPGNGSYVEFNRTGLNVNFAGVDIHRQGIKVIGIRRTGWAAASGTATRTAFATSTVTTSQLAERVKALIDDLRTHGLIGD
jgi:hypothetical protein